MPDGCHYIGPDTVPQRMTMTTPISRIQAVQELLDSTQASLPKALAPTEAIGMTAVADIEAGCNVPEHACSVRDGYAMAAKAIEKAGSMRPVRLPVNQCIRAESRNPEALGQGEAARVLTGGPVPPGADCVLAEEDVEIDGDEILVTTPIRPGWFVRAVGGEIESGTTITRAGDIITPQAAAVMTRTRLRTVDVHARPEACVMALGSELVKPGTPDDPAHFPADNLVLTQGLLEQSGALVRETDVLPDEKSQLVAFLSRPDLPEIVITTGGTGRSERDFSRSGALMSGFDILFDTVDMRPGRNMFAARRDNTLLFGLPGPPAAVFTCFHALILPVVRKLRGLPAPKAPIKARFTKGIDAKPGSEWLVQCELEIQGTTITATPLAGKEVPPMLGIAKAHGLAVIKGGDSVLPGDKTEIITTLF